MTPTMTFVKNEAAHPIVQPPGQPELWDGPTESYTRAEEYERYQYGPGGPVVHTGMPQSLSSSPLPDIPLAFAYDPSADRQSPYINGPFGYCRSIGILPVMPCEPLPHTFSMIYSTSSGRLQGVQEASGRVVTFAWSGDLVHSIQESSNALTTFQYDRTTAEPLNLLTTITWPTGGQTGFQYSNLAVNDKRDWLLTGIVDVNGDGESFTHLSDFPLPGAAQDCHIATYTPLSDEVPVPDSAGAADRTEVGSQVCQHIFTHVDC